MQRAARVWVQQDEGQLSDQAQVVLQVQQVIRDPSRERYSKVTAFFSLPAL